MRKKQAISLMEKLDYSNTNLVKLCEKLKQNIEVFKIIPEFLVKFEEINKSIQKNNQIIEATKDKYELLINQLRDQIKNIEDAFNKDIQIKQDINENVGSLIREVNYANKRLEA